MPWRINIDFEMPPGVRDQNDLIHRIRNFGEALYVAFKQSGKAEIDLSEVDRATNHFHVDDIKTRQVRTVFSLISKMLERHNLARIAQLSKDRTPQT